MNSVDSFIGRRLRQSRWICGMSQADLAQHLSVAPQEVSRYEAGAKRLAAAQLLQIADVMDLPVMAFFQGMQADPDPTDRKTPPPGLARMPGEKSGAKPGQMTAPPQDAKVLSPATERER